MKAVYNENKDVVSIVSLVSEGLNYVETEMPFETILYDNGVPIYYVDNTGEELKVIKRTEQEIMTHPNWNIKQAQKRAVAYKEEADSLCFKYQRGEIDKQIWLDKCAEIKARYPYSL